MFTLIALFFYFKYLTFLQLIKYWQSIWNPYSCIFFSRMGFFMLTCFLFFWLPFLSSSCLLGHTCIHSILACREEFISASYTINNDDNSNIKQTELWYPIIVSLPADIQIQISGSDQKWKNMDRCIPTLNVLSCPSWSWIAIKYKHLYPYLYAPLKLNYLSKRTSVYFEFSKDQSRKTCWRSFTPV